jgi:hypothetical protein
MVQASWLHLHVLSTVKRNLNLAVVWKFVDSGNKSDMLQLQVEIWVAAGILQTHFLQEADLKIVLTSVETTESVCWKWNDTSECIVT